jgi:hypothetical protein
MLERAERSRQDPSESYARTWCTTLCMHLTQRWPLPVRSFTACVTPASLYAPVLQPSRTSRAAEHLEHGSVALVRCKRWRGPACAPWLRATMKRHQRLQGRSVLPIHALACSRLPPHIDYHPIFDSSHARTITIADSARNHGSLGPNLATLGRCSHRSALTSTFIWYSRESRMQCRSMSNVAAAEVVPRCPRKSIDESAM